MTNGIFFNMFRNGDLFVVREFVRDVIRQMPQYDWHYAHGNHEDSLKDLPCTYIPMPHFYEVCESVGCKHHEISDLIPKYKPLNPGEPVRYLSVNSPLYINTWAGCWHGSKFPLGFYPNMHNLLDIWGEIGKIILQKTGHHISFNDSIIDYFPTIDYSFFNTELVNQAIAKISAFDKNVLIANGRALSGQSKLDVNVLNDVIVELSKKYPYTAFITTTRIDVDNANIFCTDTLFQKNFDLLEISYLSTFCDVIIGKNSGPFTYSHTKQNIMDDSKVFVSFSNLARDNLLYDVITARCKFVHSSGLEHAELANILCDII
jgi:hypothetical protein